MRHITLVFVVLAISAAAAQQPPAKPTSLGSPKPSPVTKLSATTYRIGEMTIDTEARTLSVPGTVNDVTVLEFVANTVGGFKAYESALTLNTNAITFNAALLLLGLDASRGKASQIQFDPNPPRGDPVEITLSWREGGESKRATIEELLYDSRSGKTLPQGPWVYTGSTFVQGPDGPLYMAESEGVLIGFMHGPQAIIDNPRDDARGGFGSIVLNPHLKLKAGSEVTLTVRALPAAPLRR